MIFIKNLNKITNEKYSVNTKHYMPFDKENGYKINGKIATKEQLEQEGILIESIPEPKQIESKQAIMYYNPIKKEIFYEYEDIPKSKEENQKETFAKTLAQLTIDNKQKDTIIKNLSQTVAKLSIEVNKLKGDA